jgi:hypothetical protein
MNESENIAFAMPREQITFYAKIQGAGAAAPVRAPTTFSATATSGFMHASNNYVSLTAADITRSGVGAYTAKLRDGVPVVLDIDGRVWSTTGAVAAKDVYIVEYNPTTRVITFGVNLATTGAVVDLLSTDFLVFTIVGQKNVPVY